MRNKSYITLILITTAQYLLAGETWPAKAVINKDTVICSTLRQQQDYNLQYILVEECEKRDSVHVAQLTQRDTTISKQASVIATHKKQEVYFAGLNKALVDINDFWSLKFGALQKALDDQRKKELKRKIGFGLAGGIVSFGFAGFVIYKFATL